MSAPIPFDLTTAMEPEPRTDLSQAERERRQNVEALRRAHVASYEVVVHLREVADLPSPWVSGRVTEVATTGAFAVVGGTHVPTDRVLRVERRVGR